MSIFIQSRLIKDKTLVVHLELVGLKKIKRLWVCMSWSRQVGEKICNFLRLESANGNDWKGLRNIRKLPCDIFLGKLSEFIILLVGRPLLVNRGIVIIWSNMSSVIYLLIIFAFRISTCCQTKVGSSMNHIHRKRMSFLKKEFKLFDISLHTFSFEILSPVCEPTRVYLASKNQSIRLHLSCFFILLFTYTTTKTYIWTLPISIINSA